MRGRESREALAGAQNVELAGAVDAAFERDDALFDAMLGGGDELGGGRGGGGAKVGDVVCDGVVDLVADGGDDGELRGDDGAGEELVVEAGEVFERASSAGDEDEVDLIGMAIEVADAGGDAGRALFALHDGGVDEEVEAGVAAADDVDDVADGGAVGRGDDADALREGGQRGARAVEEAFGAETVAELLEGELEGAGAARTHGLGDELELAAGFVYGDAAADFYREAVLGFEPQQLRLGAEEHDGKLRVAVLEGEVDVAGGGGAAVGDLALDVEDAGVGAFDVLAEFRDQLADGVEDGFAGLRGCGLLDWGFGREGEVEGELWEFGLWPPGFTWLEAQEARDGFVGWHCG